MSGSAVMCGLSILALIKRGHVDEATDRLLAETWHPDVIAAQDDGDGDSLFWASCRGYTFIVELLLTYGSHVSSKSIASGGTALHAAADNGHVDIVKHLIKWGADLNATNNFVDTPCHLAAYRGYASIVSFLLQNGADCSKRNSRNNTVMEEAKCGQYTLGNGQHSLVQYIITSHLNTTGNIGEALSSRHSNISTSHLSNITTATTPSRSRVALPRVTPNENVDDTSLDRGIAALWPNVHRCPTCGQDTKPYGQGGR